MEPKPATSRISGQKRSVRGYFHEISAESTKEAAAASKEAAEAELHFLRFEMKYVEEIMQTCRGEKMERPGAVCSSPWWEMALIPIFWKALHRPCQYLPLP